MSTQFFQRQETARTNTTWLVVLFCIAVIGIVGAAFAVAYVASHAAMESSKGSGVKPQFDPIAVGVIAGCVAGAVIVLGSLYEIVVLRAGGGSGVAESVGGRPLVANLANNDEKRLLNIVEEMAIASGTPVPPVYILDEPGINAFAAGYRPSDAVLGVTRGAIENLNREQLQGVIAHEFSHVLNGDMRLNIRMIGILHGILLLGLIGRMLFESIRFTGGSRSSSDDKGKGGIIVVMIVAGIALVLIGWFGSFIGGLIKAAVCRQREYLADASAVQFTRNPNGIGGALKRIGALSQHGRLQNPNASTVSHLFFAQGVYEGLTSLLATHPPLPKRILAIDPNWDGQFSSTEQIPFTQSAVAVPTNASSSAVMGFASASTDADEMVPATVVRDAVEHVGAPEDIHHQYSASLLASIDSELKLAAGEPYSARSLVFALLLDRDLSIAAIQIDSLRTTMSPSIVALTERLAPRVTAAAEATRLPLIDLALPMLRRMSAPQYEQFMHAFDSLIRADNRLSLFEWTLSQVLSRNLRSQYTQTTSVTTLYRSLSKLSEEVSILLTMLARVGHAESQVAEIYKIAAARIPDVQLRLVPTGECNFQSLGAALKKLRRASERRRGELLDACAASVAADGIVKVREAELLRGIADLLECPMPPLIAGHNQYIRFEGVN